MARNRRHLGEEAIQKLMRMDKRRKELAANKRWLNARVVPTRGRLSRQNVWKTGGTHHRLSKLETKYHNTLEWSKIAAEIHEQCSRLRNAPRSESARGNVSGYYPSHKMTSSIQLESRMIELPFIYQIEHDDKVLE